MIRIIPAIDIIGGRCVRLTGGDYGTSTEYYSDPADAAAMFAELGYNRIHVVDLDGAAAGGVVNLEVLRRIASLPGVEVDFGGGIKSTRDIEAAFEAGASMVTAGTVAVKNPALVKEWLERYGASGIILGADVRDGSVAVNGWKETTSLPLFPFLEKWVAAGITRVICTDISRDGMLTGPATELYSSVLERFPDMELIASGGVGSQEHIRSLEEAGVTQVIVGKAIYEKRIILPRLSQLSSSVKSATPPASRLPLGTSPADESPSATSSSSSSQPDALSGTSPLQATPQKFRVSRKLSTPTETSAAGQYAAGQKASSLAKRIIPCLDVAGGRVVKGINFEGLRDAGDPVELAARYSQENADELVFLDIKATHENRKTTAEMVRRVAEAVNIPFTVGGGISTVEDVTLMLSGGADKVSVNSAAVRNPALIEDLAKRFGSQCVVLAVDAAFRNGRWEVFLNGGRLSSGRELFEWIAEGVDRGAGEILFTSMDHDGTRAGYALGALAEISRTVGVPLIASGGAGTPEHFRDAFTAGLADAALAASLFHYGELAIGDLKKYLSGEGVAVRL
jgi:cyclase